MTGRLCARVRATFKSNAKSIQLFAWKAKKYEMKKTKKSEKKTGIKIQSTKEQVKKAWVCNQSLGKYKSFSTEIL